MNKLLLVFSLILFYFTNVMKSSHASTCVSMHVEEQLKRAHKENKDFVVLIAVIKGYQKYNSELDHKFDMESFYSRQSVKINVEKVLYGDIKSPVEYYMENFNFKNIEAQYPIGDKRIFYGMQSRFEDRGDKVSIHPGSPCVHSTVNIDWDKKEVRGFIKEPKCEGVERFTSCKIKEDKISLGEFQALLDQYQEVSLWDKIKRFFGFF